MIPVRDVIPSRTAPGVTVALLAALGAAFAWPAVREWWLPWLSHAMVLWLTGGTLEDRFGHARFAAFAAACTAAALAAPAAAGCGVDLIPAAGGATAGMIAAYAMMFPHARILTLVPTVIGIEVAEVPAWVVFGLWAVLQAAAGWSMLTWSASAAPAAMAISVAAGASAGALGSVLLRRPERMRVEWWD
ncbi:MAG: rhomboid family intramembrane serine protease [Vicinamibacterales bacterium]|jgi:membrane associated rhomboid family serine protease|nr:rhomboid family intramembrane serine protease [Vicinamibacterales bacterium]